MLHATIKLLSNFVGKTLRHAQDPMLHAPLLHALIHALILHALQASLSNLMKVDPAVGLMQGQTI